MCESKGTCCECSEHYSEHDEEIMVKVKFILSSNPESLDNQLSLYNRTVTVEAEYGDACVEGSIATLAHHGIRSANLPPCLCQETFSEIDAVGLSHVDLDALGGCFSVLDGRPGSESFWKLAAFVDVNGAHKLVNSKASNEDLNMLYAWWAWSEKNRIYPPRDGSCLDVSEYVIRAMNCLDNIFAGNEELLANGKKFQESEEALNNESFVEMTNGIILRISPKFANHLYTTPQGIVGDCVVAYNTLTGSITVSFAEASGHSACEIVQKLWGNLAGGHRGIAGSPRGVRMAFEQLFDCYSELSKR